MAKIAKERLRFIIKSLSIGQRYDLTHESILVSLGYPDLEEVACKTVGTLPHCGRIMFYQYFTVNLRAFVFASANENPVIDIICEYNNFGSYAGFIVR